MRSRRNTMRFSVKLPNEASRKIVRLMSSVPCGKRFPPIRNLHDALQAVPREVPAARTAPKSENRQFAHFLRAAPQTKKSWRRAQAGSNQSTEFSAGRLWRTPCLSIPKRSVTCGIKNESDRGAPEISRSSCPVRSPTVLELSI